MLDPVSLLIGATSLFSTIKGMVDNGHDMLDTAEKVGSLFSRIATITQLTSAKKKKKSFFQSQGEYEAEAIKLYTLKAKAHQLQLDTRNLFVGAYGIAAWTSIQKEVTEMRKEAARQTAIAMKEAEENRKDLIMGAWMLLAVVVFAVGLFIAIVLFA